MQENACPDFPHPRGQVPQRRELPVEITQERLTLDIIGFELPLMIQDFAQCFFNDLRQRHPPLVALLTQAGLKFPNQGWKGLPHLEIDPFGGLGYLTEGLHHGTAQHIELSEIQKGSMGDGVPPVK